MMKSLSYSFVLLFVSFFSFAQKHDFVPPVKIPIILNGNFGELRSNHFHGGIDIKTNGSTGLAVYSIADGYVSRISVSSSGYGNALYVTHPSGYTSVYGHLERFSPEIAEWVKDQQYNKEEFEVILYPGWGRFSVKKGEEIAKSGNSGSSGGPHLHFEIRETDSEHPTNPLFYGFKINDTSKPVVSNLYVYPLSDISHVQKSFKKQRFELVYFNGAYRPKGQSTISGWNKLGFGIDAVDYLDGNWSKCGIYKMELYVDSILINSFEMDELDYGKMRYLNSHIDYEEFMRSGKKIHKTFIDPGNKLGIYKKSKNRGIYDFDDGKNHEVLIVLSDVAENSSKIIFNIKSTEEIPVPKEVYTKLFEYDCDNSFESDEIQLDIPEGALFTDLKFNYKKIPATTKTFSTIHRLQDKYTPLYKSVDVKIRPVSLPERLQDRALLAIVDLPSGTFTSIGGEYSFGWVKASTKTFGDVCVVVDTVAPLITPLSIKEKKMLSEPGQIRFKIKDKLSGIKKYAGFIDDKWVLFELDDKTSVLKYKFDDHIVKGKQHHIKLSVEDHKRNMNVYEASFYY
jgi:hypothetical protein